MTASCLGKLLVKSKNLPIYFFLFLGCLTEVKAQEVPFSKGVNLSNWFQAPTTRQIQFTRYTKKDFEQIQRLGCDVIRLPINLHFMTDGEPDYTIDPLFFDFLDEVVSWAEELGLHLILDNHTFDPAENTDPNVGIILEKVWSQMASPY
jgi:endoglucanase